MKRISRALVLTMHSRLVARFGGIDGIRDEKLLDSALEAPFQSFGGEELYPGIVGKAARLGYGLVKNHAFLDGNKRIGAHVMLVFLALNGITLQYTDEELIDTILAVAAGHFTPEALEQWLTAHRI